MGSKPQGHSKPLRQRMPRQGARDAPGRIMRPDFWLEKWARNEIGFHQDSINAFLRDHWPLLGLRGDEPVLVPLCGKSLDMHWIHGLGHPVIGVELSERACRDFFAEADIRPEILDQGVFREFRHGGIRLLCGDIFALGPHQIREVAAVYDRAALIAWPPDMRPAYAEHLKRILPDRAQILLVTLEYPRGEMQGPPFSVGEDEVQELFGDRFRIERVHAEERGRDDPFAKGKGLSDLWEKVYRLAPAGH